MGDGYRGFTLAEVLITLGIIGVVAALTLPTLIQNHKRSVVETRLAKFYSVMNQAINMSELNNGERANWRSQILSSEQCKSSDAGGNSYDTYESERCITFFFETYLKPYFKYTEYKYVNTENLKGFLVYFSDGSVVRIKHPWDYYFYPVASDIFKQNAALGVTHFPFQIYQSSDKCNVLKNKGLEPFVELDWDCTQAGLYASPYHSTRLIQANGWKIPKDYPFKL